MKFKKLKYCCLISVLFLLFTCTKKDVPLLRASGLTPNPSQISWHEMELNTFVHLSLNTFTSKEWEYGVENPDIPPGIYFIYKIRKKDLCEQEVKMFIGKSKHCISKKPIIDIIEVEYVTDILYDPKLKKHYINIGLSPKGLTTLNKIYKSMPNSQFVLVIDNSAIGRFTIPEEIKNNNMRLGMDMDLKTLKTIRAKIQEERH